MLFRVYNLFLHYMMYIFLYISLNCLFLAPTEDEIARENYIKRTITEALGLSLKSLQQEYVASDDYQPIHR